MKKSILLLIFGLFVFSANAQINIQFLTEDTIWVNEEESVIDLYHLTQIEYTGTTNTTAVWIREEADLATNWTTAICDKNLCWGETVSTKEFDLVPDEKADLYGHFYTNGNTGTGVLRLIVHEKENMPNGDTLVIMGRSYGVGVNKVDANSIIVYPNPAKSSITVELPVNINSGMVDIYDVVGNKVLSTPLNANQQTIDVATLPKGMYIIRFADADGNIYSRRFQKAE